MTVGEETHILEGVSLTVSPGELIGIVGGSGAGKTTLLEALAGISPAGEGRVSFDGVDLYRNRSLFMTAIGYVPQDDIVHADLPLEQTLRYAARLRLPPDIPREEVNRVVARALSTLDLSERAGLHVGTLSGGQRKRSSIAVEMLTRPRVFFLDEPTSGLDPATAAELLELLGQLADDGTTVVLTTHAVQDLSHCDRVAFLAPGGRLVFFGGISDACARFGVSSVEQVYSKLASAGDLVTPAAAAGTRDVVEPETKTPPEVVPGPGPLRQWSVLTARTMETLVRNRLTIAILLGSPVMIVVMFAVLFKAGAFDPRAPDPTNVLMILFWMTFGAFFFGLTYGLLQIVTERAILRREYLAGIRLGPYLASKITVLLPFLVVVVAMMVVALRVLGRLPSASLTTYGSVVMSLTLVAAAALTLGLLASAAVRNPSQATLVLPLLCFPAVLFSGAILPVHVMAALGRWISVVVPVRWGFEAVGHDLGVRHLLTHGHSQLGRPLVESYGSAGLAATGTYWVYLSVFTLAFFLGAWAILKRSLVRPTR